MARKKSPLSGLRCEFCGAALSTWAFKKLHDEEFHDWMNLRCDTCGAAFKRDERWQLCDVWEHFCDDDRSGKVGIRDWTGRTSQPK